ncbi:MAG TPA: DNA-directed RNA polymerase subunit omega [Firmicutes bacterium]|nr:DNA-directed RNA polymerase subunit omega [Candidatus Fermentithermobacillaceae bacterium]
MINPPSRDITLQNSKYGLVIAVAKRARQIVAKKEPLPPGRKPVSAALDEIVQGKVRVIRREPAKPGDAEQ